VFYPLSIADEFNDFCDRLEMTAEWGGQAEVFTRYLFKERKLNKENAMDHSRWRKLIKDV